MDWWEDEESDWFAKYLPGQDLPDGLEWTSFNVDLTTAPDMTMCMYPGLRKGLQDAIVTVGCEDLETLITDRALQVDDDSFDPSWDEPSLSLELVPELGIYPTSRSNPHISQSAATSRVPTDSCLARYSKVDVLVEARRAPTSSPKIPLTDSLPSSVMPSNAASHSDNISHFDLNLGGDEGPLEESVIGVFNCQHRLFVFMILFVEDKARLLHFDRTGASMTPAFDYTHRPEVIGKFLYRLSRNRASMGHDPTATHANEADAELFRNLHTRYHAASAVGRSLRDAATEGWPVYKLCIEGRFSPTGSTAVLPNDPVSRREFLIGKPMSTSRESLCGCGTKVFVAYDVAAKKITVIKDMPNDPPANQFLIPTLLGGGDVICDRVPQETRSSNPDLFSRTHYRLVLKEVCRPLEDFTNSLELVTAIMCAIDAHLVAWSWAHVLHRNVSIDNLLVLDEDPEGPPNPRTVRGLLANWDLARTKEELENRGFTQKTPCGTWPFISARLQHTGPDQRHELSDDLESFVHVLNYCAVKYLPNDLSYDDYRVASFISSMYDHVRIVDGVETGSITKLQRLIENKPFVELQNPTEHPLSPLLHALSKLCSRHYHHIQFPLPKSHRETRRGGMSVERGRFAHMTVFVLAATLELHAPQDARDVPRHATAPLPTPDPAKSPFNDHYAIARAFLHTLEPPNDKHPAYGLGWPVADKIKTVKPLGVVEPTTASLSDSEHGIPPYAPFCTPNPEHSNPAKCTRSEK
ncbi:hypothetical protein V8D89_011070 [Ganoderma adspersum]